MKKRSPSSNVPAPQPEPQHKPQQETQSEPQRDSHLLNPGELMPHVRQFSLMRWIVITVIASFVLGVGTLTILFRTLQTYRYYDWTIIPTSYTRIEAACGELKLYYMGWQDPKTEKPVAHHVEVADNQRCLESAKSPTPADRFTGLKDPAVLAKLECQPDVVTPDAVAFAWNCNQPVGKLLKAEMDATKVDASSNSQSSPQN